MNSDKEYSNNYVIGESVKKAFENISKLANMTSEVEVITWEVKDNEENPGREILH